MRGEAFEYYNVYVGAVDCEEGSDGVGFSDLNRSREFGENAVGLVIVEVAELRSEITLVCS